MRKYRLSEEQRAFSYQEDGTKKNVLLRQIIAISDFNDVIAGTAGGWIDRETVLAQEGNCWIYDQNAIAFGGAVISGNTRITGTSVLWGEVYATDNVWIDNSEISQGAYISDSVTIHDSLVYGQCRIFGHALIDQHSMIVAAQGLTPDHQLLLQIYDRARVSASRIVHQAQIYGDAVVRGGPILLDEHVVIQGESRITGAVIIENHVELTDHAVVEAFDGDTVHVRGPKVINGEERITRTPLAGLL